MSAAARPLEKRTPAAPRRVATPATRSSRPAPAVKAPNARPAKAAKAATTAKSATSMSATARPVEPEAASRIVSREHRHLRVVPQRRPLAGVLAVVLVVVFLAMLGLTTFQTRMAQQQVRIDQLQELVDQAKKDHQQLLRQRAELRSPQRLGSESERLGMVPAAAVGFVTVDAATYAAVLTASGRLADDSEGDK